MSLLAFIASYFFGGSVVKWLLDYRIKDGHGSTVGEGMRESAFVVYMWALLLWPITVVVLVAVYGVKFVSWLWSSTFSDMDGITGFYEHAYNTIKRFLT